MDGVHWLRCKLFSNLLHCTTLTTISSHTENMYFYSCIETTLTNFIYNTTFQTTYLFYYKANFISQCIIKVHFHSIFWNSILFSIFISLPYHTIRTRTILLTNVFCIILHSLFDFTSRRCRRKCRRRYILVFKYVFSRIDNLHAFFFYEVWNSFVNLHIIKLFDAV